MHRKCPLILTALCFAALPARAQVSISEVCPSYLPDGDVLVLQDEDGDSPDWIELKNHSSAEVDLNGWCLSDDAADPRKWALPNETLAPDERILIWASGKGSSEPVLPRYHPLVTQGDNASYFVGTQEPPATWRDVGFDDSAWGTGPSGFGYGDGDDATFVQAGSVYLRFEFDCEAKFLRILDGLYLPGELDAIASVFIGGASMSGGIGTVIGAIVGGLIMAIMTNGPEMKYIAVITGRIRTTSLTTCRSSTKAKPIGSAKRTSAHSAAMQYTNAIISPRRRLLLERVQASAP